MSDFDYSLKMTSSSNKRSCQDYSYLTLDLSMKRIHIDDFDEVLASFDECKKHFIEYYNRFYSDKKEVN